MSTRTHVANVYFGKAMKLSRITIHIEDCRWVPTAVPGSVHNRWVWLGNFSQLEKVVAHARYPT